MFYHRALLLLFPELIIHALQYSDGIVDISYQLASSRQIIDSKVSEQIPLKGNFYIEPLASYHYEIIDNYKNDFWQAKVLLGYKFQT